MLIHCAHPIDAAINAEAALALAQHCGTQCKGLIQNGLWKSDLVDFEAGGSYKMWCRICCRHDEIDAALNLDLVAEGGSGG